MLALSGSLVAVGVTLGTITSDPEVALTAPTGDEQISRHQPYAITWTSADVPGGSALSLRLKWTTSGAVGRPGGGTQPIEETRLITMILDAQAMKAFTAGMPAKSPYSTIESGKYVWDIDQYCKQNTENGHSICASGIKYHLEGILRAANDPCADNLRCDKPRGLFKTFLSRGTISFSD